MSIVDLLHTHVRSIINQIIVRQRNGITSLRMVVPLLHRQDYGITSVPVGHIGEPPIDYGALLATGALPTLTKPYRSTTVVLPLSVF